MRSCTDKLWLFNMPYRLVLFGTVFLILLAGTLWVAIVRLPVQADLETRGIETTAIITNVRYERRYRPTRGGRTEIISYEFTTISGQKISDELRRSYNYNGEKQPGTVFSLIYLPERPDHHLSDYRPVFASAGIVYTTFTAALIFLILFTYELWRLPTDWSGPRLRPMFKTIS
ncbi:MAG: DUF3592 domain-containing protein [Pseudomonadota bacterium]